MENIILHSTSLKDLRTVIGEVVEEKLRQFNEERPVEVKDEFITRREVCSKLRISLSTLHAYSKDGILKSYRIGGRVLFRLDEIEKAVQEIQAHKYGHSR